MSNYGQNPHQQPQYGPGYGPPGHGYGPQFPPPKKGMGAFGITMIVFGILFGGCVTCGVAGRLASGDSANSGSTSGSTSGSKAEKVDEQAVVVSAEDLLAAYKANEVRADAQWKDKTVQVTGVVSDVKKNAFDGIYVVVKAGNAFDSIHFDFPASRTSEAAALDKDQTVTFRGRVSGMIMRSVMVKDARIVK